MAIHELTGEVESSGMRKNKHCKPSPPISGRLDRGISKAVKILQANGIETFESCEGGAGHAFTEPTIRFHGGPETGWKAMGVCLSYGLPILCLRRVWYVLDRHEPTGPKWEIVFRERLSLT